MQQQSIHPSIAQELLESAPNAADKGQAQYFTPLNWAQVLAIPLPKHRPVIVDLQAGNGQLLKGASRHSKLLAADIDLSLASNPNFIPADTTRLYPLLKAVEFEADLFVLNPPWDHHWHRDRLSSLSKSPCIGVQLAAVAHDGRTGADTIDSTIGTLCIALDLCSTIGEGLLIANAATIDRLIFAPNAPHAALSAHIWAHLIIHGNICLPPERERSPVRSTSEAPNDATRPPCNSFLTSVLYFARGHLSGPLQLPVHMDNLAYAREICTSLASHRDAMRRGAEIRAYQNNADATLEHWAAVAEEWRRLNPPQSEFRSPKYFNLFLNSDGTIGTALSLFDSASGRVPQAEAKALFELKDKHPMQLVIQRAQRKALERAITPPSLWRVEPALARAVQDAIAQYNAVRAPLYPLSKIQRLGYLDEHDQIQCCNTLALPGVRYPDFLPGKSYPLRSTTVRVQRSGQKRNLAGGLDFVEFNGQELVFFITNEHGSELAFMEAKFQDPDVKVSLPKPGAKVTARRLAVAPDDDFEPCGVDFTLQQLTDHFIIPEVPDVATLQPEKYQRNLQLLQQIESLCQ